MIPLIENKNKDGKSKMTQYFRRIRHIGHMDFELTFWQMLHLCIDPQKVYQATKFHRQTKNQWARDDPGFLLVQILFILISSIGFGICFRIDSFFAFLKLIFKSIFISFLLLGLSVSLIGWIISNKYLKKTGLHIAEQFVEFQYSFDIHCNSYFPFFIITNIIVYLLLPIILSTSRISIIFGNFLYIFAYSVYFYITFLGYKVLPFIQKSYVFLFPLIPLWLLFLICSIFKISLLNFFLSFHLN
ncbi:protein unc-50 [Anaeramoeba ignava]|uniref:Protein unc-50 n=1 Tax=Anaeramoeba ignava TaxID=1746090 RepID=A0A9Q0LX20_ANAIG|nr:protein unc-50 [Anaeramoeba ignava]|eukprot:Anaeramoba_ignava/a90363_19.p1 GENE.a90363_19~~a90363_19.p1  ORF type:complete len:244 (+),score=49.41 a90363_19:5-736(+)